MTRVITWSLVTSYYDILPLPRSGLMTANEPWSGHYKVDPAIWAFAHTTQFAEPGWHYVDSGCGYLEEKGGSYVTLRSPDGGDYTLVVETMDSSHAYSGLGRGFDVTFHLGAGFPNKPLHVWRSTYQNQFEKIATIEPKDGRIQYRFDNEAMYTLSTTAARRKVTMALSRPKPLYSRCLTPIGLTRKQSMACPDISSIRPECSKR